MRIGLDTASMLVALATAAAGGAPADLPLFAFDNGAGRGVLTLEEQADLAKRTGYAGCSTPARKTSRECSPRCARGT